MAILTAKDISSACDEMTRLQDQIISLERELSLYKSAIEYMQQYNDRTVHECLELAKSDEA